MDLSLHYEYVRHLASAARCEARLKTQREALLAKANQTPNAPSAAAVRRAVGTVLVRLGEWLAPRTDRPAGSPPGAAQGVSPR